MATEAIHFKKGQLIRWDKLAPGGGFGTLAHAAGEVREAQGLARLGARQLDELVPAAGKDARLAEQAAAREGRVVRTAPQRARWQVGDDIYAATARGEPSWTTVRTRYWKGQAAMPEAADIYGPENVARMKRGLAPQRYNAAKGGMESMELSHEPIPIREGGRDFVERWPCEHALKDPFRQPGYC